MLPAALGLTAVHIASDSTPHSVVLVLGATSNVEIVDRYELELRLRHFLEGSGEVVGPAQEARRGDGGAWAIDFELARCDAAPESANFAEGRVSRPAAQLGKFVQEAGEEEEQRAGQQLGLQ